jgi:uncharacterized protein
MTTKEQITSILREELPRLKELYPIRSLALFGSYSRGDQSEVSDVDILVEFDKPVGFEFIALAEELETLLGVSVDLVSKKGVKERYLKEIDQDLIYV